MKRTVVVGAVVVVLAAGAWALASPYVAARDLRVAAQRGDAERLRELVDFPELRASVKEELNAALTRSMEQAGEESGWAGLGMILASAFVEQAVDAYVSPAGLARLAAGQRVDASEQSEGGQSQAAVTPRYRHCGLNRFEVAFRDSSQEAEAVLVLRRAGLSWRLTSVRLPIPERGRS